MKPVGETPLEKTELETESKHCFEMIQMNTRCTEICPNSILFF